jgi:UDP-N-acetylglucosamine--N-acetylmuramyl-(pentapeptide) pyrophosphoryl-undecaprenol N-acetylglucosamine transferase
MRAVVTGGGTGGHLFPALAVAEAMLEQRPDTQITYLGGKGKMEERIVPTTGLPFVGVSAGRLTKPFSVDGVKTLLALLRGYRDASRYLHAFRPSVLISTGGYVAAAAVVAAARRGIPTIVQAHDTVPGRTNRWLQRWSSRICIWLEESAAFFPSQKLARTGVPLRRHVLQRHNPETARAALGLKPDLPTLFLLGGSQGARRLNELMVDAMGLLGSEVQCLHQTGETNLELTRQLAAELDLNPTLHKTCAFLDAQKLPYAYSAADILICRCGITSLAEGAVHRLPMLMVPLPTAYADHQTHNAAAVERAGAGTMMRQTTLSGPILAGAVRELTADFRRREQMSQASAALGRPNAAGEVAELAFGAAR